MSTHDDEDPILLADGLDAALVGEARPWQAQQQRVAIYSTELVLDILQKRDGMSYEEAREFFDFNIIGGYQGEQTPIFADFPITPERLKAGVDALLQWQERARRSIKTDPEGAVLAIFAAWGGTIE